MITEKNHKLLTSQLFVTDCTKKGLASMDQREIEVNLHKATTSPSNVSPTSRPFFKTYMMVKISTNQIAKNRHT